MPNLLTCFWSFSLSTWFLDFAPENSKILLLPIIISSRKINSYKTPIMTLIFLVLLSAICLAYPSIAFIIAVFSAILFILQPLSLYFPQLNFVHNVVYHIIIFIHNTKLINYLYYFYFFFYSREIRTFKILIILLNILIVIYSLTARYLFSTGHRTLFLYCLLLIGLMALYCRGIINLYIFITNVVRNNVKFHHLFEGENDLPQTNHLTEKKPLIDLSRKTTNNYFNEIPPKKWNFAMKAGLCASLITGAAACYAGYYAKIQADYAKIQADYAKMQVEASVKQNYEFERQNDLDCVDKGFMSKETYCAKYGNDCGDYFTALKTPDERAERMLANKKAGMLGIRITNEIK